MDSDDAVLLMVRVAKGDMPKKGVGIMASKQIQEDLVEEIIHRYRDILKELAKY